MSLVDASGNPIGVAEGGAASVEVINMVYRFAVPKSELLFNPDGVFEAILDAISRKYAEVVSNVRLGKPVGGASGAGLSEVQPGTGDASGVGSEPAGTGGGELPLSEARDDSGELQATPAGTEPGAVDSTVTG